MSFVDEDRHWGQMIVSESVTWGKEVTLCSQALLTEGVERECESPS